MPRSSVKSKSDLVTRAVIEQLVIKMDDDLPTLKRYLVALFAEPENIHHFGWFINKRYVELETPDFHKEMLGIASDQSVKFAAFGAPRGHAKSTTIDFTYALWSTVYKHHNFGVIISDTVSQSIEFVNALKDQFEDNDVLRWLYGDQVSDEWRDGEFVTNTGIKWVAKGAGMKVRGLRYHEHRPDLMLFDDLENDERVATPEQRKKLKNWFTKAALPALSRNGRAIIVGTILHHDSLLANILANKDMFASWKTKLYKAIMQDKDGNEYALWPQHMSLNTLIRKRDDPTFSGYIGSLSFAQEYQNVPFDPDDAIVQSEWIQWASEAPDELHTVASVITVDPAASEKTTADPTAKIHAVLGLDGNLYVKHVGNKRMSPTKAAQDLVNWNDAYQPNRIGMEEGVLGLVFRDLLKGLPMVGLKPDSDKVRRLLAVSRFFEAGQVFIVKGIKNGQALYDQLVEFPSGSHDDMVDALVYAIRMLMVQGLPSEEEVATAGDYIDRSEDRGDEDEDDDDY